MSDALNLEPGALVGGYTLMSRLDPEPWDRSGACMMTVARNTR